MLVYAENPAGQGGLHLLIPAKGSRGKWVSDFEASLVYKVCHRTAGATQINPASNTQTKPNKNKTKTQKQSQIKIK